MQLTSRQALTVEFSYGVPRQLLTEVGTAIAAEDGEILEAEIASNDPTERITTLAPIEITTGSESTFQMDAAGGTPPYAWAVDRLPAGCTMSAAGLISSDGISPFGALDCVFTLADSTAAAPVHETLSVEIVGPSPLQTAILAAAPVGFWPMNEAASDGVMHDLSGNNLNAEYTVSAAQRGVAGGPFFKYIEFASGDSIHAAIDNALLRIAGDLTVMFAAAVTAQSSNNSVLSCAGVGDSQADNFLIELQIGDYFRVFQEHGSGTNALGEFTNIAPAAGMQIYHYTRSGNTNELWIGGLRMGTVQVAAPDGGINAKLAWGNYNATQVLHAGFAGGAIFERVLSAQEIQSQASAFRSAMGQ